MDKLKGDCDQSLTDAYLEQEMDEANSILPKWDGNRSQIWAYDNELFEITIAIENKDHSKLLVNCCTPTSISGPFEWCDSSIRVKKSNSGYSVIDVGAKFELFCSVVSVYEQE